MSYRSCAYKLLSYSVISSFQKHIPIRCQSLCSKTHISKIKIQTITKSYSTSTDRPFILGIETSCDDTGCGIVDGKGRILGEALNSQHLVHLRNGGIIPPVAQELHRKYIEPVVDEALNSANLTMNDIDAIALTVQPGLPMSLMVGIKYAKYIARKFSKPIIPIHHMQAHALMARMENKIEFPFLVLLISGGHCLLALVNDVDDFKLLGHSTDDAPGEAFDKVSRRLKLRNIEELSKLCGGQAIELLASKANNMNEFEFPLIMAQVKNCDFSFGGLKNKALNYLYKLEKQHEIIADGIIPELHNLCGAFQLSISRHLCQRTKRAMIFLERNNYLPENNKTLVVSGGVASNNYIFECMEALCEDMYHTAVRPRPKLCTDNGIMIAWNGVEKWKKNIDIIQDIDTIKMYSKSPIGEDIRDKVSRASIDCNSASFKHIFKTKVAI